MLGFPGAVCVQLGLAHETNPHHSHPGVSEPKPHPIKKTKVGLLYNIALKHCLEKSFFFTELVNILVCS